MGIGMGMVVCMCMYVCMRMCVGVKKGYGYMSIGMDEEVHDMNATHTHTLNKHIKISTHHTIHTHTIFKHSFRSRLLPLRSCARVKCRLVGDILRSVY